MASKTTFTFDAQSNQSVAYSSSDSIKLTDATYQAVPSGSSVSYSGSNVIFTFGNGNTLTVEGGKDKVITFLDSSNSIISDNTYKDGDEWQLSNSDGNKIVADSNVHVVDGSKRTKAVSIKTSNTTGASIIGGTAADTLQGGGNDTLTGGKGKDVFIYTGGDDIITDYSFTEDVIAYTSAAGTMGDVEYDDKDVTFNFTNGTLTVKNGKWDKITAEKNATITFKKLSGTTLTNDSSSTKAYGNPAEGIVTVKSSANNTADYSSDVDVETIEVASKVSGAVSITGSSSNDNTITGSKYNDSIYGGDSVTDDYLNGGVGNDTLYGGSSSNPDDLPETQITNAEDVWTMTTATSTALKFTKSGSTFKVTSELSTDKEENEQVFAGFVVQDNSTYSTKYDVSSSSYAVDIDSDGNVQNVYVKSSDGTYVTVTDTNNKNIILTGLVSTENDIKPVMKVENLQSVFSVKLATEEDENSNVAYSAEAAVGNVINAGTYTFVRDSYSTAYEITVNNKGEITTLNILVDGTSTYTTNSAAKLANPDTSDTEIIGAFTDIKTNYTTATFIGTHVSVEEDDEVVTAGNTLVGGTGKDVFYSDAMDGAYDIIEDYSVKDGDIIKLHSDTKIVSAVAGNFTDNEDADYENDIKFTIYNEDEGTTGTIVVKGGVGQKITVAYDTKNGTKTTTISTSQIYATDTLVIAAADSATVDTTSNVQREVSEDVNEDDPDSAIGEVVSGVNKVNASARSKAVYIIGTQGLDQELIGGTGADTIESNGYSEDGNVLTGGKGANVFKFSGKIKEKITDWTVDGGSITTNKNKIILTEDDYDEFTGGEVYVTDVSFVKDDGTTYDTIATAADVSKLSEGKYNNVVLTVGKREEKADSITLKVNNDGTASVLVNNETPTEAGEYYDTEDSATITTDANGNVTSITKDYDEETIEDLSDLDGVTFRAHNSYYKITTYSTGTVIVDENDSDVSLVSGTYTYTASNGNEYTIQIGSTAGEVSSVMLTGTKTYTSFSTFETKPFENGSLDEYPAASYGEITIMGGLSKKINLTDTNGAYSQVYGNSEVTVANADGSVIDFTANKTAFYINAKNRSTAVEIIGPEGHDATIVGGSKGNTIFGGDDYANSIVGGAGADELHGNKGDTLTGGAGKDTFAIDLDSDADNDSHVIITDYAETKNKNDSIVVTALETNGPVIDKDAGVLFGTWDNDLQTFTTGIGASGKDVLIKVYANADQIAADTTEQEAQVYSFVETTASGTTAYALKKDNVTMSSAGTYTFVNDDNGTKYVVTVGSNGVVTGVTADGEAMSSTYTTTNGLDSLGDITYTPEGALTYGNIVIVNGKDQSITFADNDNGVGSSLTGVYNNPLEYILTTATKDKNVDLSDGTDYEQVVYIDGASKRTTAATITGNSNDDTILGTKGNDLIDGFEGANSIVAGAGNDTIIAGAGGTDDEGDKLVSTLEGGAGNDVFYFTEESGSVIINDYEAGKDVIRLANGLKIAAADKTGNDVTLTLSNGGEGEAVTYTSSVSIATYTSTGHITLELPAGASVTDNEVTVDGYTITFVDDSDGDALVHYNGATVTTMASFAALGNAISLSYSLVEESDATTIVLKDAADASITVVQEGEYDTKTKKTPTTQSNQVYAPTSNAITIGKSDGTTIDTSGNVSTYATAGAITVDVATTRTAGVVIIGNKLDQNITGGKGNDTIYAGDFDVDEEATDADVPTVNINGGAGNDILYGGAGKNVLNGGDGADTLIGGKGELASNTYTGGAGNDIFRVDEGMADITITDYTNSTANKNVDTIKATDGLVLRAVEAENNNVVLSFGAPEVETEEETTTTQDFTIQTYTSGSGTSLTTGCYIALTDSTKKIVAGTYTVEITNAYGGSTTYNLTVNTYGTITAIGNVSPVPAEMVAQLNGQTLKGVELETVVEEDDEAFVNVTVTDAVKNKTKIIIATDSATGAQQYGVKEITVENADGTTIDTTLNTTVEKIDASKRTKAVTLVGNSNTTLISGGTAADVIYTGGGQTTLTGNKGNDTFFISADDEKVVITDYATGTNKIQLGEGVEIEDWDFGNGKIAAKSWVLPNDTQTSAGYGNDSDSGTLVFKLNTGGILALENVISKKKVSSKVTFLDNNGRQISSQTYSDPSTLTLTNSANATVTAEEKVVTINAASVTTKALNIVGNDNDNTITGGSKNDTLTGGDGADVFVVTVSKGNDIIKDYDSNDDYIYLGSKTTVLNKTTPTTVSGEDLILNLASSTKNTKTVNTVTIKDGATSTVKVIDYGKTTANATSYSASSSYVASNVEEPWFAKDDVIATANEASVSSITESTADKAAIATDYSATAALTEITDLGAIDNIATASEKKQDEQ